MTTAHATVSRTDEALARAGRWLLAKIWIGCLLSGTYAAGRHFGMPQFAQSILATFGAVMLALAAFWLPIWTRDRPTGIVVVDVGLRAVVWAGLGAGVVALLIGRPAVGCAAGALLLTTAWRTFRDRDAARPPARFRPAAPPRPSPEARRGGPECRPDHRTPGGSRRG